MAAARVLAVRTRARAPRTLTPSRTSVLVRVASISRAAIESRLGPVRRAALGNRLTQASQALTALQGEAALLSHPDVLECAVIGRTDEERGQIVEAHVVLAQGREGDALMVKLLQDHVKRVIAPYKYPRAVIFVRALPKTQTGKIQRFRLRDA